MDFIRAAHLPSDRVKLCAASAKYRYLLDALRKEGIEVIEVEDNINLDSPVASHADMNMIHLGGGRVVVAQEQQKLVTNLRRSGLDVIITAKPLQKTYPLDIQFNCLLINNVLIGKIDNTADEIKDYCIRSKIKLVNVNQGYTKCSVAVVDESAIITSDSSIASVSIANGIDVLVIEKDYIKLEGYDTGFIGGCCFKYDRKTLVFTGDVSAHKSYDKIKAFVQNYGIGIEMLSNKELVDIGSVIPLK